MRGDDIVKEYEYEIFNAVQNAGLCTEVELAKTLSTKGLDKANLFHTAFKTCLRVGAISRQGNTFRLSTQCIATGLSAAEATAYGEAFATAQHRLGKRKLDSCVPDEPSASSQPRRYRIPNSKNVLGGSKA